MSKEVNKAFDKELGTDDLYLVWEKAGVLSGQWDSIGIMLGLSPNKLNEIEVESKTARACLRKVFECWLKRDYDYKSRGVPTLRMLCNCIKSKSGGANPALADEIEEEYSVSPANNSEELRLRSSSPVDTSSSKAIPTAKTTFPPAVYVKRIFGQYAVPDNLNWMIEDLQKVFIDTMHETKKSFRSLDISEVVDYILSHIPSLLSPHFRKHQTIELMREEFDQIKMLTQLFRVLDKYISWFNFEFIVNLVSVFITDDRDLLRKWSTYREKLKDYFKNNNTQAVQIDDATQFGISYVPGTKVMVAAVEKDDYTLNDLYFFHKAIADALEVPNYPFYFCTIEDLGCTEHTLQHGAKQDTQEDQVHVSPDTINKWLKEGSVELTVTRVTMCGLPGTGKTCAQNLLLNKEALSDDSTQIADRTVRATRVSYDDDNWDEVTREEMLGRLKADLLQKGSKLQVSVTTSQQKAPTSTSESTSENTSEHLHQQSKVSEYTNSESDDDDDDDDDVTDSNDIHDDKTVITELLKTDSVKGFQKKEEWLYIIDSGGQPAYQELLPLFTRAASLNIITIDLSKPLNEELVLEYRTDGKSYPCHSKSTQLACFESTVSSGAIFEPLIIPNVTDTAKQSHSMHMILGTHYNDDNEKVGERERLSCEERLSKFVSSLQSYLCERIIKASADSMVFHVNSLAESSKRKEYREKVCKAIWGCGADASCKFKLPIRWFAFELSLPESCVITESKAISIGGIYEMGKEDTIRALKYLHHVSLVLYYPNVALVFTSPQPILKILSQLLALTYQYDDGKTPNLTNERISLVNKEDLRKGFFKKNLLEILKESSEVFSEQHFKSSHLIDILCQLNIIHPEQDGSYFIPYALPSFKTSDQKFKKEPSFPKPLCILYWTKKGRENQNLPIPQGLFPLAIVYLLNQEKVKIPQPKNRTYMCRDAMTLSYGANILHMINQYSHIEVHYIGPKEDCPDIRKLVFKAITDGSAKINIKRDYIHLGFTCKHDEIIIVDEKGNRKTPCSSTELSCSLNDDTYKCWFNENATSPGVAQSSTSDIKDNDSQEHKCSTTKRQASVRDMDETVTEETDYHSKRNYLVNDEHTDDMSVVAPQSLGIKNLKEILSLLKNGLFNGKWENLGLQLGLYKHTLNIIQANYPRDNDACLRECVTKWLERADGVDNNGGANYVTLAKALEEMDQKNTADYIHKNT